MDELKINGHEYPFVCVGEWTYDEAAAVKRVTGLTVGMVPFARMHGDALCGLAFAVVGHMRAKPGVDPDFLRGLTIDDIDVTFDDDENEAGPEDDVSPPAEAADGGKPDPEEAATA